MSAERTKGGAVSVSNLRLRVLTAVCLGIFTLAVTCLGGWGFAAFALLMGGLVLYEWNVLVASLQTAGVQLCGWICYLCVAVAVLVGLPAALLFLILLAGTVVMALLSGRRAVWIGGGFVYAALPAVVLVLLRGKDAIWQDSAGFIRICFLYAVVWGTDIGAYFCGRALGGPKLAPALSPNKTWSGAIGGAVAAIICGGCVALFMMQTGMGSFSGFAVLAPLTLLLSIVSQLGDIGESSMKRRFQVKDSGTILPGHGGVMDRVDGLVTASVAFYVAGLVMGHFGVFSSLFNSL